MAENPSPEPTPADVPQAKPPFNEVSVLFPLLTIYTAGYLGLMLADFLLVTIQVAPPMLQVDLSPRRSRRGYNTKRLIPAFRRRTLKLINSPVLRPASFMEVNNCVRQRIELHSLSLRDLRVLRGE